jgi:hypothetical protein
LRICGRRFLAGRRPLPWYERSSLGAAFQRSQHEVQVQATGQALGEVQNEIIAHTNDLIGKIEHKLFTLVERRFGELMGRLDGFLPERPRPKDFRFANERDDGPTDLPNPLTPRRRVLDS